MGSTGGHAYVVPVGYMGVRQCGGWKWTDCGLLYIRTPKLI